MLKSAMRLVAPSMFAVAAPFAFAGPANAAGDYPDGPIEWVCATSPGSGAARWCMMMANEMGNILDTPINVVYRPAGSSHEAVVHTYSEDADGYTILHGNGSFPGYFNLPHFTRTHEDFQLVARIEQTLYGIAVRCDDPEINSWEDMANFVQENPGELAMGSNKVGSLHHRHHARMSDALGGGLRFVPYEGTGDVVSDVVGGHLRVGFAQPGLWNSHIEAGTICPLLILNEDRLDHPQWEDVPSVPEVGLTYEIPHQWQGFFVKIGTPEEIMDVLSEAAVQVLESEAYQEYLSQNPHVMANFEDDRDHLQADFAENIASAREFMIENEIIED